MNTKLFGVVSALLMLGASTINSAVADTFALSGVVDIYNNTYSGSFDYSGGGVFSNANIVFNKPQLLCSSSE